MKNSPLITNLLKPAYLLVALGIAVPMFTFQYYLMATLPGTQNLACTPGANLTLLNISFALTLSLLIGIMVSAIMILFAHQMSKRALVVTSTSGIASVVGVLTAFCTICALPFISLLGITVSLELFTDYNIYFKLASFLMLVFGLYFVNKRLLVDCAKCRNYKPHQHP